MSDAREWYREALWWEWEIGPAAFGAAYILLDSEEYRLAQFGRQFNYMQRWGRWR